MLLPHILLTLRWAQRDRLLHAVLGSSFFLLFLVPTFSLFSMRQAQELAITLCFSILALILLVLVLLLGGFSLWREVDRRYTSSVLTLPGPRVTFVVGRFFGVVIFLVGSAVLTSAVAVLVILVTRYLSPSELSPQWGILAVAAIGILAKFILLAAFAVLFSSVSTSFFLPFFGTIATYLVGSASQQVYEYLSVSQTANISSTLSTFVKILYYILPNFSVFDFKVQAIYGLLLDPHLFIHALFYLLSYSGVCLALAVFSFSRRQFP